MGSNLENTARVKAFGGSVETWKHRSSACDCDMQFGVFLPPQAAQGPVPAVYWLSGLTCTEENFMTKAGAQRVAAELGIALIAPDTSPRGVNLPGEDDSYDFGSAAGFYLNATQDPWSRHYHMYEYVTRELPELVEGALPVMPGVCSISGHSMGGHGALICALKNPGRYKSVSAFAPICAPTECPWGEKAFSGYLGDDRESWKAWDACELLAAGAQCPPLLVDQGAADGFLKEQLKPERLQAVCVERGVSLELRMQPGYDHSYYFIATFIEDHLRHHAAALGIA